jgi:hypothetical protein
MIKRWILRWLDIEGGYTENYVTHLRKERDYYRERAVESHAQPHIANGTLNALMRIADALAPKAVSLCTSNWQEPEESVPTLLGELVAIRALLEVQAAEPKANDERRR